jgi:hypothetical protein
MGLEMRIYLTGRISRAEHKKTRHCQESEKPDAAIPIFAIFSEFIRIFHKKHQKIFADK